MKVFFDTSAFAKRYINESGSEKIDDILENTSELALCIICIPEFMSALNRLKYDDKISIHQYRTAKTAFFSDIEDIMLCVITPITIRYSVELIEQNKIRGMDSLHVASALEWKADLFVSSDVRQINAAKNSGLKILSV